MFKILQTQAKCYTCATLFFVKGEDVFCLVKYLNCIMDLFLVQADLAHQLLNKPKIIKELSLQIYSCGLQLVGE